MAEERLWTVIYKSGGVEDSDYEVVAATVTQGELSMLRKDGNHTVAFTRHNTVDWVERSAADDMWDEPCLLRLEAHSFEDYPTVEVWFDVITVRKYVYPEPVVGSPGSPETEPAEAVSQVIIITM